MATLYDKRGCSKRRCLVRTSTTLLTLFACATRGTVAAYFATRRSSATTWSRELGMLDQESSSGTSFDGAQTRPRLALFVIAEPPLDPLAMETQHPAAAQHRH